MGRGRPVGSVIRQNIVEILNFMGKGYGYEVYKAYRDLFAPVTMRSIYYHLNKGIDTGEFRIAEVKKEEGKYSWGSFVTKTYYSLEDKAKPAVNNDVKAYFEKKK